MPDYAIFSGLASVVACLAMYGSMSTVRGLHHTHHGRQPNPGSGSGATQRP
uniref:Uncharacterized protein n=1 Tax=Setaria italica TaxID=4555 RepID=K4ANB4_SETIT